MQEPQESRETMRGRSYGVPARRACVVTLLTEAYARDDLEQKEFERRVELAEQAGTIEELDALVADFPPEIVAAAGTVPSAGDAAGHGGVTSPVRTGLHAPAPLSGHQLQTEVARLEAIPGRTRLNVIGDHHVSVRPEDERVARFVSLIGDCTVDLRGLAGEGGAFVVRSVSLIGDTKVLVTPGTPVEVRLFGLIGDQQRTASGGGALKRLARKLGVAPGAPDASSAPPGPTVVVTGFRLIGDTVIVEG